MPEPLTPPPPDPASSPLRERLWRIIFLADTKAGRAFDVLLLVLISASVLVVMMESVEPLRRVHQQVFFNLEWIFTLLFTVEYIVRVLVVRSKRRYVLSFFGIGYLILVTVFLRYQF